MLSPAASAISEMEFARSRLVETAFSAPVSARIPCATA